MTDDGDDSESESSPFSNEEPSETYKGFADNADEGGDEE
ncbi:hypothetical protein J2754_000688 [Halarchaeum solikamskense]|nr:hypothetical protein [Halarchaeum solikamskense]